MIVQKLSDGTYRIKDITHRQYLKRKGYSDKEIREIEKRDIARGAARPGDMDKPMKGAPDVTRMFKKDAKIDQGMSMLQKINARIERTGYASPGLRSKMAQKEQITRDLYAAIKKKDVNTAKRLLSDLYRIFKFYEKSVVSSPEKKSTAQKALSIMPVLEKEIMAMDSGLQDAPEFKEKMQRAKMNYLKKKGLSNYEAKNLKWVDGKLYYNNKNTGFTVNQLIRDAVDPKKITNEIINEQKIHPYYSESAVINAVAKKLNMGHIDVRTAAKKAGIF